MYRTAVALYYATYGEGRCGNIGQLVSAHHLPHTCGPQVVWETHFDNHRYTGTVIGTSLNKSPWKLSYLTVRSAN